MVVYLHNGIVTENTELNLCVYGFVLIAQF